MFWKSHRRGLVPVAGIMAILLMVAAPSRAATATELLQQAIYTEETVGDLEKAVELYEQVIAEGKSAQGAAAQALYRMAMIHRKMDRQREATEALERLVKEYPGQTELVAKARQYLVEGPELKPAPWEDGEVLQMDMKLANGREIGTFFYQIQSAEEGDQKLWRCSTRGIVTLNGVDSFSSVLCEQESFRPIKSYWRHSELGTAEAQYQEDQVQITYPGTENERTIPINRRVFDNEQAAELFRRLPLEVGYKTTLPLVSSLGAGLVEIEIDVPATETVTVPAGTFECFKLVLNIGQEFWVSTDEHRYLVRFAAGGVTADLTEISRREPGQPVPVKGDAFSLQLPEGWFAYRSKAPSEKTTVYLIDPRGAGFVEMMIGSKDSLPADQQRSPREWTKSFIEKFKQTNANLELGEGGIRELQVAGHPGASFSAEFTPPGTDKKTTLYGIAVLSDSAAATFRVTVPADSFADFRTAVDGILETFKLQ